MTRSAPTRLGLAALALLAAAPAAAQTVLTPPAKLAPFVGHYYTPAQANNGFWGTDLGFAFKHKDKIRFLFGDSWADTFNTPIGSRGDDAVATVDFAAFPSGDKVDQYVQAHPAPFGALPWLAQGPPVSFPLGSNGKVAPIEVYSGGLSGTRLNMSLNKTPMAGFSNARSDAAGGAAFAIIGQYTPVQCTGAGHVCPTGLECDTGLGLVPGNLTDDPVPCVLASNSSCQSVAGGGLCQDRTSSVYDTTDDGRIVSTALQFEVGSFDRTAIQRIYTQPWPTNKFINPATRTVKKFDPLADPNDPTKHDYTVATGSGAATERVFLWGRPNFEGLKLFGRDLGLYFAYVDMPTYSDIGNVGWTPHYFKGIVAGKPTFSDDPADAKALDLHGSPTPETEVWDITNQMSVSYVAPLKKWVMLYGGGNNFLLSFLSSGLNALFIQTDPENAIHARFADHPWGPWSAPQQALRAGDPNLIPPLFGSEYGPLGIMHHDFCVPSLFCVGGELSLAYAITPWGFMYAPVIVDEWTTARPGPFGTTQADIYWIVSTWDPYQTVLLRSRLVP
jgi:hypothetical protein